MTFDKRVVEAVGADDNNDGKQDNRAPDEVRVGPAHLDAEQQKRVVAEVARMRTLGAAALRAVVLQTLEEGGVIRLAAIEQLRQEDPVVGGLISDIRNDFGPTNIGRGENPTDPAHGSISETNKYPNY